MGNYKSKGSAQGERMDEKMNILFLSLSFSQKGHTSFYEDLLREFRKHGHHVYVACANEKRSQEKDGLEMLNGLPVLRIRTGNVTGDISIIEKGISTLTIDSLFLKAVMKEYGNIKFDLIMYPTPPITLVNTIAAVKKHTGAKTYLLLKDIFPQNAVDLGMMAKSGPKKLLYKFFRNKEKKLYRISDYIGCMSPANCRYVIEHNSDVNPDKVEVCPNCIRVEEENPPQKIKESEIRKKYNIPEDSVIFIYGGNLGKPQGIPFLIDCLRKEKDNKKAFFLIVGAGSEYGKLQRFMEEEKPQNSLLLSYLPKEDYQRLADQCDVGMIFLDHRFTIPNFPSRLLSCLNAAMPVLVATDTASDMGQIAEENGFGKWCESNNVNEFTQSVDYFIRANKSEMGKVGWHYLKNHYSLENGYEIVMKHFENNKKEVSR